MERLRGSWLGIAVVLTLFGLLMLAAAVRDIAIVLFLIALVAWIFAIKFYVAWLRLRRGGDE